MIMMVMIIPIIITTIIVTNKYDDDSNNNNCFQAHDHLQWHKPALKLLLQDRALLYGHTGTASTTYKHRCCPVQGVVLWVY